MKNIAILGATGSIGKQSLEVIKNLDYIKVIAVSCKEKIKELEEIICHFHPQYVSVEYENDKKYLEEKYPELTIYTNDNLTELVKLDCIDTVLNALVGSIGTICTIEAIKAKKDVLLANKESLVLAGDIITSLVKEYKVKLFPIDSEHSAIYQCLDGREKKAIDSIIITASGGALRDYTREELKDVTLDKVLDHPTWRMGNKVTIDSSTMVNKGLEVIEAHHLFAIDYNHIKTVLHQESSIHGAVRFVDGSILLQAGPTDMRLPIQYALTFPKRLPCKDIKAFDITKTFDLHFKEMDYERYPMLALGYKVGYLGGIMPAVYSIANEVAVNLFLKGKIKFLDIESIISDECNTYQNNNIKNPKIEDILRVVKEIEQKYNTK